MKKTVRRIIKEKVTCPKCKGKGRVYDHELSIFTFGIGLALQALSDDLKDLCPKCQGDGWIYRQVEEITTTEE